MYCVGVTVRAENDQSRAGAWSRLSICRCQTVEVNYSLMAMSNHPSITGRRSYSCWPRRVIPLVSSLRARLRLDVHDCRQIQVSTANRRRHRTRLDSICSEDSWTRNMWHGLLPIQPVYV